MGKESSNEKIPVLDGMEPRVNRYYLKVSRKYMAAGIALMLTLIGYIIFVLLFLGQYVTYVGRINWIQATRNRQRESSNTTMGGTLLPVPRTAPARLCRMASRK